MKPKIVVVGTFAVGVSIATPRLPRSGETLHGSSHAVGFGGKGSNQAIACARLGADVEFITCLGNDAFGDQAIELYRTEGVGTAGIWRDPDRPTGLGTILVEPDGGNAIVVDIGANRALDRSFIDRRSALFDGAAAVLTVTEAPIEAVTRTVEVAWEKGIPVVLNPAPAVELGRDVLTRTTVLTPNLGELAALSGRSYPDGDAGARLRAVRDAAASLRAAGAEAVVVTLGAEGALIVDVGSDAHYPAPDVTVVDTTGAGDAFSAGLTVFLAEGLSLHDSVRHALCCGSLACTRREVVPSLPSRVEVIRLFNSTVF